ncbi:MAG: MBL fold metallo-hydrolase [Streptosporangiaceae bacterium]|jgi:glyoxylase-like metal-dependent hydrolase (beta-lactamase superfamily II)
MIRTLGTEFAHFFLLEQDGEVTLIDAGLSGYRDTLEPALAEMGRSIDDVKAIVLTHADPDHVGFAGELQASRGIPVYVHRADSERTRQGKTKHTEVSPLAMLTMLKRAHSRRALRHMIANGGAKQSKIPEVIPFGDGDELDVPGRLRVIHTPGHTEGHCVLYAPLEDALFIGDAINNLNIVTGQPGAHVAPQVANTSTNQAYESLSRIEELDAQTLYFGHGDPSTQGTRAIVAEARAKR